MGPEDMPVQSTPKEVDPGDVALLPENDLYEDIYQRVLGEVRARIDQRIADIEAQAVPELVEAGDVVDGEHAGAPQAPRRRPLLRAAITLAASAGLIGAVVTLARDHTEAITSVTDRIDAAVQAIRASPPKAASTGGSEMTMGASKGASNAPDAATTAPALPPSASPSPEPAALPSSDPSSAMAEATPERDMPSGTERDLVPLIEKIARDVVELQVGLQGLKSSQEQASRDQAKAIEQLQASQDQLARAVRAARTEMPAAAAPRLTPRPLPGRPPRFP